jgi:hypothetical protein
MGWSVMTSAKEYRQYAEECLTWAKQAETASEQETLLKMAEDWRRAAAIEQNVSALVPPTRPHSVSTKSSIPLISLPCCFPYWATAT